jgi:hypothetical protein
MRPLTTIVAISDDRCMSYQIHLFLESLQEQGFKSDVHILIFRPADRPEWSNHFDKVEGLYPKVKFFRYSDDGSIINSLHIYHTLHRLYSLKEHFKAYPELEKHAILYLDSDVILTQPLDLEPYLEDEICYGANIASYNNLDYFDGKISRVRPEKLEEYKREDPLQKLWLSLGVDRELLRKYNDDTAGVHYLLKNIDYTFWEEVLNNCIPVILQFNHLNQKYIEGSTTQQRANNGWQAFCADIFVTLWSLWKQGKVTKHLLDLDFTWATDPIENVPLLKWFHCAGAPPNGGIFYKGKYSNNQITPFEDTAYIQGLLNSEISKKSASHVYVEAIENLTNKYYKQ